MTETESPQRFVASTVLLAKCRTACWEFYMFNTLKTEMGDCVTLQDNYINII